MNKRNKNKHSEKKNLLIYAHYYIPDTASTGQILRELAEGMLDRFNITVICVVHVFHVVLVRVQTFGKAPERIGFSHARKCSEAIDTTDVLQIDG